MAIKFLRTGTARYKRLGKGRRKKQRWRRPRGRHNKIRERRKGRALRVQIGYRSRKRERGKIRGKTAVKIQNLKELEKLQSSSIIIIGKLGKKKREMIIGKAKEKGIEIINVSRNLR